MKRPLIILLAAVGLMTAASYWAMAANERPSPSAPSTSSPGGWSTRIVDSRVFTKPYESQCDGDFCGIGAPVDLRLGIPVEQGWTSTSATFVLKSLQAPGEAYQFISGLGLIDADNDHQALLRGKRHSAVLVATEVPA